MYQFSINDIFCFIYSDEFSIAVHGGTILVLTPNCIRYFNGKGEKVAEFERKRECISKPVVLKEIKGNPFYFEETDLIKDIKTTIRYIRTVPETVQIEEVKKLRTKIESFPIIGDKAMKQHTQITNHIDTIIFDIGGVFSFPDPDLTYRIAHWAVNNERLFEDSRCFEYKTDGHFSSIANIIDLFKNAWNKLRAEGEHYNSTKAYNEFISLLTTNTDSISPDLRLACSQYFDLMNMRRIATYTKDLLSDLRKKGYKLYYLSNLCQFQLDQQRKLNRLDFLEALDGGVFSCETPWRKPDKRLYQFLIEKYKINPKSSLFLDDVQENVDTAKEIGFDSTLFEFDIMSPYKQPQILQTLYELPSIV